MTQILKKLGYQTILKNKDGNPRKVWMGTIKHGDYGDFIAVEQHWVNECNAKGQPTKTKFAGRTVNFPADPQKCKAMLDTMTMLVKKGQEALRTQEKITTNEEEFGE